MVKEHAQVVLLVMFILDLAVTAAVWTGCYYVRFHSGWLSVEGPAPSLREIADVLVITLLLAALFFGRMGMYRPRRTQSLAGEFFDIVRACLAVWVAEVLVSHFLHTPRVSIKLQVLFLACWPTALIAYRGTVRLILRSLRRRGRNLRTVVIVGAGRLGQKLLDAMRHQAWTGYDVLYFVEDRRIGSEFLGVPVFGPIGEVDRIISEHPVDAAFVALGEDRSKAVADVLDRLATSLVDVNVVPDLLGYHFLRHEVRQIGRLPIVNLTHSPQSGWSAIVKRVFDVAGSLVALIVFSPLLLVIAAVIKLTSSGPVFYRQRRASLGGKEFDIIKFRSMVPGAAGDAADAHEWSTSPCDPRITPVGRILRKLSLDELPQLFNVLKGDMSLVGPRPEQPRFIERFSRQVHRYVLRQHVKAGITGWAQVNGFRGRTDLRKRIQYDLDYINRWSLGFDLWILVRTVSRGFLHPPE